jgi:PAS domain S-box-containing protein
LRRQVAEMEEVEALRRRAEGQLLINEEKYRHIYENIQDIYYEISLDGIILELSPSIERLTKYTRSELIGTSVYDIYAYPEEREKLIKMVGKTGIVTDYEITLKNKDRRLTTWSLCSRIIPDDTGVPCKIIGTMRDITERKRTEEALRESEERYRSVVENIGIGVALISPNMEILTLNNQMKKWFPGIEVSKNPICFQAFNNPPRDGICSYCPTCKTLRDGHVHESVTETPTGTGIRNYRVVSSPIKDVDGNVIAAIEMVDDITESKKMQERLEESETWYRTLFETTAAATMIIEEDTTISLVNSAFVELSRHSKWEIEGKKSWTEFIAEDDVERMREYHRLRRMNPKAAPRNYEFRLIDRDGGIRDAFMTIAIVPGTTKSVASLLDVTGHKQVEEALRVSEARLRALIDNLPFEFWATDSNLCYIMQNVASLKNYGNVVGKRIGDLKIPAEVKTKWVEQDKKALGGEILHEEYEKDVEGNKETFENFVAPVIVDEDIIGIVGVSMNVTARKRAEEALKESEEKYRSLASTADSMYLVDRDCRYLFMNEKYIERIGLPRGEVIGRTYGDFHSEEDKSKFAEIIKEVFKIGAPIQHEYKSRRDERYFLRTFSPVKDQEGKASVAVTVVSKDITDRRQAEEILKRRERELEVKSRNLEELNTALKVLLKQREKDREELEERTLSNIKHLVMPYIEKLKNISLETKDVAYVNIVESNLRDIVSPFSQRLSSKYANFTPKELQVANLIKEGKTTKEIAELLNASTGTVDFHRNNIRNKLNLKNKRVNLRSYLLTFS